MASNAREAIAVPVGRCLPPLCGHLFPLCCQHFISFTCCSTSQSPYGGKHRFHRRLAGAPKPAASLVMLVQHGRVLRIIPLVGGVQDADTQATHEHRY